MTIGSQECRFKFPYPDSFDSVNEYLDSIICLFKSPFIQALSGSVHITEYFLGSTTLYHQIIPRSWQSWMDKFDQDDLLDYIIHNGRSPESDQMEHDVPESLQYHFQSLIRHSIGRKPDISKSSFQSALPAALTMGMSVKKIHECHQLAEFLNQLCTELDVNTVVDIGSGKGYLGRILALKYARNVIAVETIGNRSEGAKILDKSTSGRFQKELAAPTGAETPGHISHVEMCVSNGDLSPVLQALLSRSEEKVIVTGLHACGNLTHHTIRSLQYTANVAAVSVVGCCYNLMTVDDEEGFPMSKVMKHSGVRLSTTSRMLACQAPQTWTKQSRDRFFKRLFYRAILERIFIDLLIHPQKPIGKLRDSAFASFTIYCNKVMDILGMPVISEQLLNQYMQKYQGEYVNFCILWTYMACTTAPIVESIINLDRYYYLIQQSVSSIEVKPIFEYSISARNLLVTAIK